MENEIKIEPRSTQLKRVQRASWHFFKIVKLGLLENTKMNNSKKYFQYLLKQKSLAITNREPPALFLHSRI